MMQKAASREDKNRFAPGQEQTMTLAGINWPLYTKSVSGGVYHVNAGIPSL
jgi:hypothetical protein